MTLKNTFQISLTFVFVLVILVLLIPSVVSYLTDLGSVFISEQGFSTLFTAEETLPSPSAVIACVADGSSGNGGGGC